MASVKRRKGWRMRCIVGEVTERLENELSSLGEVSEKSDVGEAKEGLENEL